MEADDDNNSIVEDERSVAEQDIEELSLSKGRINRKSFLINSTARLFIYPKEFTRVLMQDLFNFFQLGYEPKAPVPSLTILGRPCLLLPNIISYIKYIKSVDGFLGCYRGVAPFLLKHSLDTYVCNLVCDKLDEYWRREVILVQTSSSDGFEGGDIRLSIQEEDDDLDFYTNVKMLVKEWISRIAGIVASYPFQVIAVQTMAEFVGREQIMKRGIATAADRIYKESGILGFYNGLIPRVIGETVQIFSIGCLGYFLRTKVANEEGRAFLNVSLNVLLGALIYPFNVISTTMAVNGSGLMLGSEPFMPRYNNWLECWAHLSDLNQLRRGSSLIFRYYTGPTVVRNGIRRACTIHFGPDFTALPQ